MPPPTDAFTEFARSATVDWSDPESVIESRVAYARMLAGRERRFDEAEIRDLVRRDVARADDIAALQNHDLLENGTMPTGPLSSIAAPTLVIHGSADPMFPLAHGQALAEEIPDARLIVLKGAGHGIQRADWDTIVRAIAAHTSRDGPP